MVEFEIERYEEPDGTPLFEIIGMDGDRKEGLPLMTEEEMQALINAIIKAGVAEPAQFLHKGKWIFSQETKEMLFFPIADEDFYEASA